MRYNGLDLLRCILMLLGPLIHVIAVIDPFGNWRYFSELNNNNFIHSVFYPITFFRMEVFFVISGFFSLLILEKRDDAYFLNSRMKRVVLPFFSSLFLVTPICYLLNFYIYNIFDLNITNTVMHLWFLLTLYIVSILLIFFKDHIYLIFKQKFIFLIFTLFTLLLFNEVLNLVVKKNLDNELYRYYFYLFYNTIYYSVFFLFGLYFYHFRDKFFGCLKFKHFLLFYIFVFLFAYFNYYFSEIFLFKSVYKVICLIFSFIASIYIFNLFKDMNINSNGFLVYFVDKAILIYIFHFPVTIFICYLLDIYIDNDLIYFSISLISVMVISIMLSHLISKSKVLNFLFGVKK